MKPLLIALCLCAPAVPAQQEPTPFWLPPAPVPAKKAAPPPKKKPVAPALTKRKQVVPGDPPAIRAPPHRRRQVPPPLAEPQPRTRRPATTVEPAPELEAAPRTAHEAVPAADARPRSTRTVPEGSPAVVSDTPGAEPLPRESRGRRQRLSIDVDFGLWGSSRADGGGSSYDVAYGLRLGYELWPDRLELDLLALRAGRTAGTGFANASTEHDLFALRAFYLIGTGHFTALLGGGAGFVLAQTRYTVQDVGGMLAGLDATSARLVIQATAGGRARVYRGLDLRMEISALLRDGRLDVLPLAAAGWAF